MDHKKLDNLISQSIRRSLKRKKLGYIWEKTIGITYDELKLHLEKQFTDKMNWDNYGSYWVLDKIIPIRLYRYSDRINNEFQKAWSLKNLRPLEKAKHTQKRNRIEMNLVEEYNLYDILPIGKII